MASGASKGAKKIRPFDEQPTQLAMGKGKTPSQIDKTKKLDRIKQLTREGKHPEAQDLYKRTFPPA